MARKRPVKLTDIRAGDYVKGHVSHCERCGNLFIGAADARLCCSASTYRYRDADKRRAYMREYMRRRRKA